jgi:hypothetical protein
MRRCNILFLPFEPATYKGGERQREAVLVAVSYDGAAPIVDGVERVWGEDGMSADPREASHLTPA